MSDAEDADDVIFQGEQHPIVAEAQAKGTRKVALKGRHVAATGTGIVQNAVENAYR
jgi:hypothetical protein